MNRRISKFKFLRFVLALLVLSLAILLTACNNNSDDKEFSSDGIVFTLKGGNYEVTGYNGNAKYVVIPSIHQSRKVTGIADGAINSERDFRKTQQKIPNKIENSLQMIA